VRRANNSDIPFLVSESDKVFGKGYMTEDSVRDMIEGPEHYLYVGDRDGQPVVALYLRYEPDEVVCEETGVTPEELFEKSGGGKILHSKFMFVREDVQKMGIAQPFLGEVIDHVASEHPEYTLVYGVLWEYNGNVPVQKCCERNGYTFWKRLHQPYYKDEDYYCIICKGRCKCDGLLYIKSINREEKQ
jgi:GNAT superfamily N-acetyltransferase